MKELFIKFLKKHGALRKFKANLKDRKNITIDYYCNIDNDPTIGGGFTWKITPEGYNYWSNLDRLWEKYKEKSAKKTK